MEEKIFLINMGRWYDEAERIGYVKGTEEDALKYCEEYNARKGNEEPVWYEELEKLN